MKVAFQRLDRHYQEFRGEFMELFDELMKKGNFILGNEVTDFEKEFAEYCGAKYCVGVASGLDALTLSLISLDLKPGDEVIVPANTYIATWIAISRAGLKPVPVEPENAGFQIDVDEIEKHITERTRAIMPVHLYYQTPDMDSINDLAERYGLRVVSDAAQGHGVSYKGKRVGSTSEIEAFSFFPTKNLGAFGDGGAVVTSNEEIADSLRMLRNYGTREKYISEVIGYNSRLDEMQATFLRHKLKNLDRWNSVRRTIAKRYLQEIKAEILQLPEVKEYALPNWHIFPIMSNHRDELYKILKERGIQTIVHYPAPPFKQNAYTSLRLDEYSFPKTVDISKRILSIPLHPYLTDAEIDQVIENINDISKMIQYAP